jgi:hypothetical protein
MNDNKNSKDGKQDSQPEISDVLVVPDVLCVLSHPSLPLPRSGLFPRTRYHRRAKEKEAPMRRKTLLAIATGLLFALGCGPKQPPDTSAANDVGQPPAQPAAAQPAPPKEEEAVTLDLKAMAARFAPTDIGVDEAMIPAKHRKLLAKLVEAARVIDELYLVQVSKKNLDWRRRLAADPAAADALAYFDIMYGPWDRLDENKPFWGSEAKPAGATFYPEDMKKEELEAWVAAHPAEKEAFTGYFTVIERDGAGLKAVPFSAAYRDRLESAAKLLEDAAKLAKDKRLEKYLRSRAAAFRSNDYRPSDMDWMDLGDGDVEVVIGPYETYEDRLFGYKAAFESFVTLRDPEASKKLAEIKSYIPEMEAFLPIDDRYKNKKRGAESPISVVDVLYTAGNARAGVQTLAFNLPNDEVVQEKKGSKKVMLKNVAHAKYEKILVPIARQLLAADQVDKVSFDAFFNHTLVHETAHGLGPGKIKVTRDGKQVDTTVSQELKDLYSAIEELKADVLGMYLNYFLIEKGMFPASFEENIYASFLGGFFRSVRFGVGEAHGNANVVQFNYLMDKGAIEVRPDGKFAYVPAKMKDALKALAHDVLMIEARGDYDGAKAFIAKHGEVPPELAKAIAGLTGLPTDLKPVFTIERQMQAW